MQPINYQPTFATILPTDDNEAVISFDIRPLIKNSALNLGKPLPKNIYLLLDNSCSMNSSVKKVNELLLEYFTFVSKEANDFNLPTKVQGSTFDNTSKAIPTTGDFIQNLSVAFNADGWITYLAHGLNRATDDWLSTINPTEPYENLMILVTDGANQDGDDVKKIKDQFIEMLKTKNVALYIFGFDSRKTAASTINNFTNLNDDDSCSWVNEASKINYFFIDTMIDVTSALQILKDHRTVLKNATVSLHSSDPETLLHLVGYPNSRYNSYFIADAQASNLKSLIISIQNHIPNDHTISLSINGVDPSTGIKFSSEQISISLPEQIVFNEKALLATIPLLAKEARLSKNFNRQTKILELIKSMKERCGGTKLLNENEKYLEIVLKNNIPTEDDELLDALKSLSIGGGAQEMLDALDGLEI